MKNGCYAFLILYCGITACGEEKIKKGAAGTPETAPAFATGLKQLQQQVTQYPDSTGLRIQLATLLDSAGLYREALQQMDRLTRSDSTNYGLWFTRGQVAEHGGDTAQAIRSYTTAIRLYPSPDALLGLANLYAEQKNEKALQLCKEVKRMRLGKDMDANCAFIEGVWYARTGHTAAALSSLDACIANNYTYMEAYMEKGLLYFDGKQYTEALQVFAFASKVNNLYPDAYYYQARAYEMMGKKDSAVLRYQQSLSLDKNLQEAHTGLHRLGVE